MRSIIDDYEERKEKKDYEALKKIRKYAFKELAEKTIEASKNIGGKASTKFGQIASNYYKNTKSPFPNQEHPIWEKRISKKKR